ncbi:MAG: DUF4276 family protein [Gemmataceae bacterium]|nr:DUF4276 family protein [Gemmataceae bacterium]
MKRLVLCVEGAGDVAAAPNLVGRLLTELPPDLQTALFLDNRPMEVGEIAGLTGAQRRNWTDYLERANKRPGLGAVLLLLDGDVPKFEARAFCAATAARTLAERSQEAGAGVMFSVAVVFLRQEFESLLIASYAKLPGCRADVTPPANPESAERSAKEWLAKNLEGGYKATRDQARLAPKIDFDLVRAAGMTSFRRLERAVQQLAIAVQTDQHISSPAVPPPPPAEPA